VKPLFTVHAGEFLTVSEIERRFRHVNVWIPAKDTGVDLLVSNTDNSKTVSLQVKFSRDYFATHLKEGLRAEVRAFGWWTPTRMQIEKSSAQYWIFVLYGFDSKNPDFIIIKPDELLKRLNTIHQNGAEKFHIYLWVTTSGKCYETRGLDAAAKQLIADKTFTDGVRDFSNFLNQWGPIEALNAK
jgi:hypothetical protein